MIIVDELQRWPTRIRCFSANGASRFTIASERSTVIPSQPSAFATWKLNSTSSSDGPKPILWM